MFTDRDTHWMQHAIQLAQMAAQNQEVPVGAVLVVDDKIVGEGSNRPISQCDPSAHAEMIALRDGAKNINNYRLVNSTLYVTLEPCLMCIGALVHARVKRVVFGAYDPKGGAVESVFQIGGTDKLNHRVECQGGLLAEQCGMLLSEFFRSKR
ncbi:MAG: tRNA adenosine(34) deaminase TadA [Gammaproteobacteria bacterium]